jgi:hypothetical protein
MLVCREISKEVHWEVNGAGTPPVEHCLASLNGDVVDGVLSHQVWPLWSSSLEVVEV